jgi:hypothetical protein
VYTKETSSTAARVHSNFLPPEHLLSQLPSAGTHTEPDNDVVWFSFSIPTIREGMFFWLFQISFQESIYVT